MKLKGGYRTDERFVDIPDGSWVDARNILLEKGFESISNENGNVLSVRTGTGLKVCGIIPTYDSFVVFSTNSTTISEIGIYKDGVYTKVIHDSASLFNFNINNPIEGVFKFNYKGDIIVAWVDGVNTNSQSPKILNLTNLPFEVDGSFELVNPEDINLAKIFPNVRVPEIIIDNVNPAGGTLDTGDYYFAIAYEIENNDLTNFIAISIPIAAATLISDSNPPYFYNDTSPGDATSVSVSLIINNLDLSFGFFRLAIISKIEGIVTANEIGRFPTDTDFDVNGNGKFTYIVSNKPNNTIDLETIFINNAIFDKVKAITAFESRLYFGNLETSDVLDYQKYANNIKLKYGITPAPKGWNPITTGDITYTDLTDYTLYRTFMPEEVYAIYIHLVMKNGTVSKGFHITGRQPRAYTPRFGNRLNYTFNSSGGGFTVLDTSGWLGISVGGSSYPVIVIISGITYTGTYIEVSPGIGAIQLVGIHALVSGTLDMYLNEGNNEDDLVSTVTFAGDEVNIDPNVKIFQVYDTADEVSGSNNGLMGYWENENELYPDTDEFDIWGIIAGVNTNLSTLSPSDPNYVATLRNEKVKHHKMPGQVVLLNNVYTQVPNVIGIQPYDITIPNEIEDLIQGFYFSFVKRDFNNRIVISNDMVIQNPVNNIYGNTYDFALLTSKPVIAANYIKYLFHLDATYGINAPHIANGAFQQMKRVDTLEYHPDNNSATIPSNASRAENVSYKYTDGVSAIFDTDPNDTNKAIGNLYSYLKNIYLAFNTQQDLISTGKIIYTDGSNTYSLIGNTIYGGDCFINFVATDVDTYDKVYYAYCSYNIAYREKDATSWGSYAYNHYQYNTDYSSLLDIKIPSASNPFTPEINKFPFRINRSNVGAEESLSVGWRVFSSTAYFEMPKDKGEIWSLAHLNKELLIQMKYSLFSAKVRDRLATSGAETFLGVSDVFDREPDEIVSNPFGYIGSQSQWASFVCKIGYVVCDRKQGKIFIYQGGGSKPLEISELGQRNLFISKLDTIIDIDNPFDNNGLTANYDEKNERIVICKKDIIEEEDKSLTISFSVRDNAWICKHDYFPNHIFSTRKEFYLVHNSGLIEGIYQHNVGDNGVFTGIKYKSYIDVVFKQPNMVSKIFDSVNWKSEIIDSLGVNLKDRTITHIMIYNTTQCSDVITINTNTGSWFTPNTNNVQETWKFNDFRDIVKDKTLPFLDENNAVISSNINNNKNWFDKSLFIDKFVIIRFIYDNVVNNDIYISDVNVALRETNE